MMCHLVVLQGQINLPWPIKIILNIVFVLGPITSFTGVIFYFTPIPNAINLP